MASSLLEWREVAEAGQTAASCWRILHPASRNFAIVISYNIEGHGCAKGFCLLMNS